MKLNKEEIIDRLLGLIEEQESYIQETQDWLSDIEDQIWYMEDEVEELEHPEDNEEFYNLLITQDSIELDLETEEKELRILKNLLEDVQETEDGFGLELQKPFRRGQEQSLIELGKETLIKEQKGCSDFLTALKNKLLED